MKALISIGTALCLAFALSAAHNLDALDAQDQAAQKNVQQEQAALARFERAAQAICGGQNTGWRVDNITLTCTTKRGFTTKKVSIQ
jgi:hypothetical protein